MSEPPVEPPPRPLTGPAVGPVPGVPGPAPEPPAKRKPSTLGGAVYLLVVGLCAAGLLVVAFGPWRRGITLIGSALLLAALFRVTLSERSSGMLRVRGRWFDTAALVGVGVVLIVLAANIPNQPA
ncbi:MAG: DUF3017 domain-containing protein [Marmoricola sp.]